MTPAKPLPVKECPCGISANDCDYHKPPIVTLTVKDRPTLRTIKAPAGQAIGAPYMCTQCNIWCSYDIEFTCPRCEMEIEVTS